MCGGKETRNCCSWISKVPLPMPCVENRRPFMQLIEVAVSRKYATENLKFKIMWKCFRAQYTQKLFVVQVVLSIVNHILYLK